MGKKILCHPFKYADPENVVWCVVVFPLKHKHTLYRCTNERVCGYWKWNIAEAVLLITHYKMFLSLSNWLFVKNRFVRKYFQNEFHLHMDWGGGLDGKTHAVWIRRKINNHSSSSSVWMMEFSKLNASLVGWCFVRVYAYGSLHTVAKLNLKWPNVCVASPWILDCIWP